VLTLLVYAGFLALSLWLLVSLEKQLGPTQSVLAELIARGAEFDALLAQFHLTNAKSLILYLVRIPNSVWLFQLFTILWYPVLVTLMSYDCISHDAGRGSLRFLLQRVSRPAYFLSKFLSHTLVYLFLQGIALTLLLFISSQMIDGFTMSAYGPSSLRYFIVFIPYLCCFLASAVWISSTTKRSGIALIRLHLLWIYFVLIGVKFPWATPLTSDVTLGLMMPEFGYGLIACVGFFGWMLGFLLLGLIPFARRDL
jgi:ABC-type transport system involved in multi-copper enzyme maturation permease subunit